MYLDIPASSKTQPRPQPTTTKQQLPYPIFNYVCNYLESLLRRMFLTTYSPSFVLLLEDHNLVNRPQPLNTLSLCFKESPLPAVKKRSELDLAPIFILIWPPKNHTYSYACRDLCFSTDGAKLSTLDVTSSDVSSQLCHTSPASRQNCLHPTITHHHHDCMQ
jgi:hypothetical protein